jgi:ubiquinone/menaquinone biosynthesis C-methylase UbiE
MNETDVNLVAAGYDAVYAGIPKSPTFQRIWRTWSLGADYPEGFEHISFLTLPEMRGMAAELRLTTDSTLVDLACGMGGPGLWIARETGARLIGIDVSAVALENARARALALHMSGQARFAPGTFARTGLDPASADGAMSVDALQYAPDKQAALDEAARVLRPGGRLVFACFELEPERVAGLPVLGTDPVGDYRPVLEQAGFDVLSYAETAGWRERLTRTYQAALDARPALTEEMGEAGCGALLGEISITLQIQPYRGHILVSARRR